MQNFPLEQNIRTLVDEQLKNLGWNLSNDENCNVYQEQPRTLEEKKKLNGKRPDYVLYPSNEQGTKPIAIIETKKPGASLDQALKQGDWYAEQLGAPIVFATDGIFYKTFHTQKHSPLYLNGDEVDELMRELEALKFLQENEVNTISTEVIDSRKELIRIFEESNNILRDEGLRAGIERFGEFANILFLKLIGELEELKEKEDRTSELVLDKYLRWSQWKDKDGPELLSFVNDTVLPKIGEKYGDKDIFTPLTVKNPEVLKKIVNKLDPLNLINIDSDIKGDSFEYFLKQSTATKNDLGEYFTPRHIVKVMVKLLNPQIGETIYDPFCGTGGTLIESFKHISTNMARTPSNWKQLREATLFGNEITTTARITKMNMILAGDGHSGIHQQNSLKNPAHDKYDIVITNMPYSQKTEYGSYYELPTTNGDSICIQHCIEAINKTSENGRMALVVPEGFLFRKDLQKTREYLLDRCTLKSIISLPQGVFLPYTGVKTNILYLTNVKKKKRQDSLWYFDVKNDGYSLDSHRRKLEGENDLQRFLEYRNLDVQDEGAVLKVGFSQINMDDVRANDYVLSGSRYAKSIGKDTHKWSIVELGDQNYFEIQSGGTPSSTVKEYWGGDINWVTLADLPSDDIFTEIKESKRRVTEDGLLKSSAKIIPAGSVLVSSRATIGRVGIARTALATNQGFKNIVIKDSDEVDTTYLAYVMVGLKEKIEALATGATFKEISKSNFEKLEIPLPPIEIQRSIATELDKYHSILIGARLIYDNYAQKIEGDSSWPEFKISEVCSRVSAAIDPTVHDGNVSYIGLENIESNTGRSIGDVKANYKSIKSTKTKFEKKDVLLGKLRPNLNKVYLSDIEGICSTDIYVLRPNTDVINPQFLATILRSSEVNEEIVRGVQGAQLPRVSWAHISNIKISVPPLDVQLSIADSITHEAELIESSREIIDIFNKKIQHKVSTIWKQ
jgi:type I restriction enzyme M protein